MYRSPESRPGILERDQAHPWIGWLTRVVGRHRLKDYDIIVKEVSLNGECIVKVQATLKRERIPLSNLELKGDSQQCRVLSEVSSSPEIPVPSTLLPEPTDEVLSPAWDPSSRTPGSPPRFCKFSFYLYALYAKNLQLKQHKNGWMPLPSEASGSKSSCPGRYLFFPILVGRGGSWKVKVDFGLV